MGAIEAIWKDVLDRKLHSLDLLAIEVRERTLLQADDHRFAFWASERVLRAHGLLPWACHLPQRHPELAKANHCFR